MLAEEGLEVSWGRQRTNSKSLWNSFENLGLELHVKEELRLPTLTTVKIPEGVDGKAFTKHLLNNFGVEIGGGLGDLAGKVWRIGLMGHNARSESVDYCLDSLKSVLNK